MARATGKDKDMAVKGQIAEAMWIAESVRAFLYSAEHQAESDQWGNYIPQRRPLDTSRNLFLQRYPRLVELVQLLGSSSLMATPSEADFSNDLSEDVARYFQVEKLNGRDRIALFRLAHDFAVSGFGSRQMLYERFFFGPPNILASVYFDLYNKDDMMDRVDVLLKATD
jgi:4-hydroxyphenylacetate 3-monooxygenase